MTQKQTIIAVLVVAAAILLFVLMYQYQSQDKASAPAASQTRSIEEGAPVPESVDDITEAIVEEAALDQEVLAAEEAEESAELQSQTNTINDLGNAYDENSY